MKTVTEFPYKVKEIEHTMIPLSDGIRLAARIWMPEDAMKTPVPAILEYIPYRKRDFTAYRDSLNHPYFAGHGYASIRVDMRGSGESEGILADEYLEIELVDGMEVLRWIADQPWCDGNIGMMGISWGGFNGLQIAAHGPEELKAVMTVCSSDDRYSDDVHYMGGCLLGDNLSWASTMFAFNSCPPDPELAGDRWRDLWFQRLEGSGLWLETWLRHQRRDRYWRHGSIAEDYTDINCPVMAVSGWADGYSNTVFRMLENLHVPRKGLIGPWSHRYPHMGVPGPAIGFLQECLRWWDHWLKNKDTGIMDEPMLRVWMQDSMPPTTSYSYRRGRWVAEDQWPSGKIEEQWYPVERSGLGMPGKIVAEEAITLQSPLTVGLFAGKWCSYSATPDLPHDQREEDGGALIFESEPLTRQLELMGTPLLNVDFISNKPVAMIAVRISDVALDGKATRVTYGLLNLTHRKSHEEPENLEPGKRYQAQVKLNGVAQVFPKGHKVRISISTSYWPIAWPSPEPVMLKIFTGKTGVMLPVRQPRGSDAELREFDPPEAAQPVKRIPIETGRHNWLVERDLAIDKSTLKVIKDDGIQLYSDINMEVENRSYEWYSSVNDDFSSIRGETWWARGFRRGDWHTRVTTRTVLTSDPEYFYIDAELDAFEGDTRVYSQNWNMKVERDFM
ncbi:MAG: CocE/NonD family hydrolase [Spirochaetota bacterium]